MAGIGGNNPLPFLLGGEPSKTDLYYQALRSVVGTNNKADEGTLEDLLRVAKARALAVAELTDERAAMQAFPDLATDHIPIYERILGITPPINASDEERRQVIIPLWVLRIESNAPGLEQELQAIDERLSLVHPPNQDAEQETNPGRAFEPFVPTDTNPDFRIGLSNQTYTDFPNYSTNFVSTVLFNIGNGVIPNDDQRIINEVKAHMNQVLPGWVGFQVVTALGFILDTSLLDLTALNNTP